MKERKILCAVIFCTVMLMATAIVAPYVSAQPLKQAEKEQNQLQALQKEYEIKAEKVQKFLERLDNENLQGLHDIVMMIWEIISIFIGHNGMSLLLTRLCCCWFVFPIVVMYNMLSINVSGGGILGLVKEYFNDIDFDDLFYRFGALVYFAIPFIYVFIFFVCTLYVLKNGTPGEGIFERIKEDLEYIYNPYYRTIAFKPDNSNKSNYTFNEYVNALDINNYIYHTGLFGLSLSPIIIFWLLICFHSLQKTGHDFLRDIQRGRLEV